jgi:hypothetical protein
MGGWRNMGGFRDLGRLRDMCGLREMGGFEYGWWLDVRRWSCDSLIVGFILFWKI